MDGIHLLFLMIVVPLVIAFEYHQNETSIDLIEGWAASNEYEILACKRRFLLVGPYFLRHRHRDRIYRLHIRDTSKNFCYDAWVRCRVGWCGEELDYKLDW